MALSEPFIEDGLGLFLLCELLSKFLVFERELFQLLLSDSEVFITLLEGVLQFAGLLVELDLLACFLQSFFFKDLDMEAITYSADSSVTVTLLGDTSSIARQ